MPFVISGSDRLPAPEPKKPHGPPHTNTRDALLPDRPPLVSTSHLEHLYAAKTGVAS